MSWLSNLNNFFDQAKAELDRTNAETDKFFTDIGDKAKVGLEQAKVGLEKTNVETEERNRRIAEELANFGKAVQETAEEVKKGAEDLINKAQEGVREIETPPQDSIESQSDISDASSIEMSDNSSNEVGTNELREDVTTLRPPSVELEKSQAVVQDAGASLLDRIKDGLQQLDKDTQESNRKFVEIFVDLGQKIEENTQEFQAFVAPLVEKIEQNNAELEQQRLEDLNKIKAAAEEFEQKINAVVKDIEEKTAPLREEIAEGLDELNQKIENNNEQVVSFFDDLGEKIGENIEELKQATDENQLKIEAFTNEFTQKITEGTEEFQKAISPVLEDLREGWEKLEEDRINRDREVAEAFSQLGQQLEEFDKEAKEKASNLIGEIETGWQELGVKVEENNKNIEAAFTEFGQNIQAVAEEVKAKGDELVEQANQGLEALINNVAENNLKIEQAAESFNAEILDGLKAAYTKLEAFGADPLASLQAIGAGALGGIATSVVTLTPEQVVEETTKVENEYHVHFGTDGQYALQLLDVAQPYISKGIMDAMHKDPEVPVFVIKFFENQSHPGGLIDSLMRLLIKTAVLNISKKQIASLPADQDKTKAPQQDFANAVAYLLGELNRLFANAEVKIARLDPTLSTQDREIKIKKIMSKSVNEVLMLAFPNGPSDLKLQTPIDKILWKFVIQDLSGDALYDLYKVVTAVGITSQKEALAKVPHGEFYLKLTEAVGKVVEKKLPEVVVATSQDIAKEIVGKLTIADSEDLQGWLAKMLPQVVGNDDPGLQKLWGQVGSKVELVTQHLLLSVLKTGPSVRMFADMALKFQTQLRTIEEATGAPTDEQLLPLCNELVSEAFAKAGLDPNKLPFFGEIQKAIADQLIIAYQVGVGRTKKADTYRSQLPPKLAEACKKIAAQAVDFAGELAAYHEGTVVDTLFEVLNKEFKNSDIAEIKAFGSYWREHAEALKDSLHNELLWVGGDPKAPEELKALLAEQLEGILLKVFAERSALRSDPKLFEEHKKEKIQNALSMLKDVTTYFDQLKSRQIIPSKNKILQKEMAKQKLEIKAKLRFIQLEKAKASPDVVKLDKVRRKVKDLKEQIARREAELQKERLAQCDSDVAGKMMGAIGINGPEDFGLPMPLAAPLWESMTTNVVPELFVAAHKMATDPLQMKKIMLTAIVTYEETVAAIENGTFVFPEVAAAPQDQLQRELNTTCGNLVLSMVEASSLSWAAFPLRSEMIRNAVGEKVGIAIREQMNLFEGGLVESFLEAGLSPFGAVSMLPTAQAKSIDEIAKKNLSPEEAALAEEDRDIAAMMDEERINTLIKQKSIRIVSNEAKKALGITRIQNAWRKFQKGFDGMIKSVFGQPGLAVKKFLDVIYHAFFFTFLGTILLFPFRMMIDYAKREMTAKIQQQLDDMSIDDSVIYSLRDKGLEMTAAHKLAKEAPTEETPIAKVAVTKPAKTDRAS